MKNPNSTQRKYINQNKLAGDMIACQSQSTYFFKNYLWINVDGDLNCTLEKKEMEIIS